MTFGEASKDESGSTGFKGWNCQRHRRASIRLNALLVGKWVNGAFVKESQEAPEEELLQRALGVDGHTGVWKPISPEQTWVFCSLFLGLAGASLSSGCFWINILCNNKSMIYWVNHFSRDLRSPLANESNPRLLGPWEPLIYRASWSAAQIPAQAGNVVCWGGRSRELSPGICSYLGFESGRDELDSFQHPLCWEVLVWIGSFHAIIHMVSGTALRVSTWVAGRALISRKKCSGSLQTGGCFIQGMFFYEMIPQQVLRHWLIAKRIGSTHLLPESITLGLMV